MTCIGLLVRLQLFRVLRGRLLSLDRNRTWCTKVVVSLSVLRACAIGSRMLISVSRLVRCSFRVSVRRIWMGWWLAVRILILNI